jgi:hypothetical protein
MRQRYVVAILTIVASILAAALTVAAQDPSAVKVQDGLALSDFKGYESWQTIAPSETPEGIKAILGNGVMIAAYRAGIPANGKAVPDGAMMAKIEWSKHPNTASPYAVSVPETLKSLAFMVKDAKRFAASGGWGYAKFDYVAASDRFQPAGTGSACGYACHTKVKAHDFVFTSYPRR